VSQDPLCALRRPALILVALCLKLTLGVLYHHFYVVEEVSISGGERKKERKKERSYHLFVFSKGFKLRLVSCMYRRRKLSFDFFLSFFLLSFQRPLATSFAFLEVSHDSVGLLFFCGALSLTVFCLAFCSASLQVRGKGAPG
jgi:hypothetical protein